MSRPYPHRRKKRPGRRPPHHYRGGYRFRPNSFQDYGARHIYDWIFADIRGRQRRRMFNVFSSWLMLSMGVMGAVIGWGIAGPLGAILGFGGGAAFWGHLARKHRLYRP